MCKLKSIGTEYILLEVSIWLVRGLLMPIVILCEHKSSEAILSSCSLAQSHFPHPKEKGNDRAFESVRSSDGGACATLPARVAPGNHCLAVESRCERAPSSLPFPSWESSGLHVCWTETGGCLNGTKWLGVCALKTVGAQWALSCNVLAIAGWDLIFSFFRE